MAMKNILVHIDSSAACEHRINAAIKLAHQHQAQLTSLYVVPDFFIPAYVEAQVSTEIIEEVTRKAHERAQEAQRNCEGIVSDSGLAMSSFIEDGNLISTLRDYARYTDLVVLGQNQPQDPDNMSDALADNVVLEGGTPCLVIPYAGTKDSLGKRVLLAWNASRESARATKDAMSILKQAEHVEVLSINPEPGNDDESKAGSTEISVYLAQHGIKTKSHIEQGKHIKAGEVILSHAADIGADMILMGAYGHSRLRELVLGGVTTHLLKHMTVPIFISH